MVSDSFLPSGTVGDTLAPASPNRPQTILTTNNALDQSASNQGWGKQPSIDPHRMSMGSPTAGTVPQIPDGTTTPSPCPDRSLSPLSAFAWSPPDSTASPSAAPAPTVPHAAADACTALQSCDPDDSAGSSVPRQGQPRAAGDAAHRVPGSGGSNTTGAKSSLHTLTSLGLGLNLQDINGNHTTLHPDHSGSISSWQPFVPSTSSAGTAPSPLSPPLPPLQRSVSADATAPQHELLGAIQLLRQQLSFLVQAWMADRERLEPQKQQADEELARLQTTMESARQQWSNERAAMEQQLDALRTQVHVLQEENAAYKSKQPNRDVTNNGTRQAPGQPLGSGSITGMSSSSSDPAAAILSPNPSLQSGSSKADILSLPPGLDGASRRPHFASLGSTRTSPIGHPAPLQVAALDPRILPQKSADKDFLAPPSSDDKLLTIIDVHEIDPKLEGIPIKANALKRATFSPPRSQSEMSPSSRRLGQVRDVAARRRDSRNRRWSPHNLSTDRGRTSRLNRTTARDQTMQVLAAEESRRLTMHAGHTPNHSLSLLPTMTATGGRSTTEQSRGGTPSAEPVAAQTADTANDLPPGDSGLPETQDLGPNDAEVYEPVEGHLQPSDDVPLKGPLMLKNLPAQDDIFFEQLNKRLESLSRGQGALPSVLQSDDEDEEGHVRPAGGSGPTQQGAVHASQPGSDVTHAKRTAGGLDGEDEAEDGKNLEPEVPLRFKSTSNFGKPFGAS